MPPADINQDDNQEATTSQRLVSPTIAPIFNAKLSAGSSPASIALTAPTIETMPTRTDSDPSFEPGHEEGHQRQVIAVSVSKGPSSFFNLARKVLVTDEECDLSALEGAIVSAVDAAHLLERSQIATISRVQTSYVTVDPKKKKEHYSATNEGSDQFRQHQIDQSPHVTSRETSPALDTLAAAAQIGRENIEHSFASQAIPRQPRQSGTSGTLRRARMIITVQRTEAYKKWLKENPVQDIMTSEDD